jgi:hypothetical protein
VYEWLQGPYQYGDEGDPDQSRRYAAEPGCGCGSGSMPQPYGWGGHYRGEAEEVGPQPLDSFKQVDWFALGTGVLGFLVGVPVGAVLLLVFAPELVATSFARPAAREAAEAGGGFIERALGAVGL